MSEGEREIARRNWVCNFRPATAQIKPSERHIGRPKPAICEASVSAVTMTDISESSDRRTQSEPTNWVVSVPTSASTAKSVCIRQPARSSGSVSALPAKPVCIGQPARYSGSFIDLSDPDAAQDVVSAASLPHNMPK